MAFITKKIPDVIFILNPLKLKKSKARSSFYYKAYTDMTGTLKL